jgi:hypothetical protein
MHEFDQDIFHRVLSNDLFILLTKSVSYIILSGNTFRYIIIFVLFYFGSLYLLIKFLYL